MPGADLCRHKMININIIKFLKKKREKSCFLKVPLDVLALIHFHTVVKARELRQKINVYNHINNNDSTLRELFCQQ